MASTPHLPRAGKCRPRDMWASGPRPNEFLRQMGLRTSYSLSDLLPERYSRLRRKMQPRMGVPRYGARRGRLRHTRISPRGSAQAGRNAADSNGDWLVLVYLFVSAYMRMAKNVNENPLILSSEPVSSTMPPIPNPSVVVLRLQLPNRDCYRLGVGVNLNQLLCKAANACGNTGGGSSSDTANPAPTIQLDTTSAPAGSPNMTLNI